MGTAPAPTSAATSLLLAQAVVGIFGLQRRGASGCQGPPRACTTHTGLVPFAGMGTVFRPGSDTIPVDSSVQSLNKFPGAWLPIQRAHMSAENTLLPRRAAIKSHPVFSPSLRKHVLAPGCCPSHGCLNPRQAPALLWFAMVPAESELRLEGTGLCWQGVAMALPPQSLPASPFTPANSSDFLGSSSLRRN